MKMRFILCFVLLFLGCFLNCHADGGGFSSEKTTVITPDQRAIIFFDGEKEFLAIDTSFISNGGDEKIAWVVPTPSLPEVSEFPKEIFEDLSQEFSAMDVFPAGITIVWFISKFLLITCCVFCLTVRYSWVKWITFALQITTSAILFLGLVSRPMYYLHPQNLLFSGFITCVIVSSIVISVIFLFIHPDLLKRKSRIFAFTVSGIIPIFVYFGVYVNDMLGQSFSDSDESSVKIHRTEKVGDFIVSVVSTEKSKSDELLKWLNENGFKYSSRDEKIIQQYAKEGWFFSFMKLDTESMRAEKRIEPHPLLFSFETKQAVYPLRLTSRNSDSCRIDLYVFGNQMAKIPYFNTRFCKDFYSISTDQLALELYSKNKSNQVISLRKRISESGEIIGQQKWESKEECMKIFNEWYELSEKKRNLMNDKDSDLLKRKFQETFPIVTALSGDLSKKEMEKDAYIHWKEEAEIEEYAFSMIFIKTVTLHLGFWLFVAWTVFAAKTATRISKEKKILYYLIGLVLVIVAMAFCHQALTGLTFYR